MTPYQTLYRKYRSQTFADLVGQDSIVRALTGAVAGDRVAHAYLFSGSRGTGKTTSARLLAKAINCLARTAGSAEPCNSCDSCVAVAAGTALDLVEIDAASNRGIEEIRDLRERVNLAPALGRWKVYIIDEAHMLTTEAFNALLKTLEEPPPHVVFVLCTTEAQKVPATVLGRCQQFVFRRFNDEQVVARLADIAGREGIPVDPGVLDLVARVAQGSMRDALGLFDQLVPLASGSAVSVAVARELLGVADPADVVALVDDVLTGRPAAALDRLGSIYERGGELRQVVRAVMEDVRDRLVAAIERRDTATRDRLSAALDALLHLDGEVRRHAEPRLLVEATLVRVAVAGADAPVAASAPEARAASGSLAPVVPAEAVPLAGPGPVPADVPGPVPAVLPGAARGAVPANAGSGPPSPGPAAVEPAAVAAAPPPPLEVEPEGLPPAPAPSPLPAPEPLVAAGSGGGPDPDLEAGWRATLDSLSVMERAYLRDARPELAGDALVLWFPYSFHQQKAEANRARLLELAAGWLGRPVTVEARILESAAPAGASSGASGPPPERPPAPEEHEIVQRAVRQLEGRVTQVTVPKERSR